MIVSGEAREFVLAGIATPAHRVDVPSIFFSAEDTTWYAGPRIDALGIFPTNGTSARDLAKRLDLPTGVSALTGDDRGAAEFAGIATSLPLIILSGVFGGMVAVVMALVVSATIGLSVRQRRRELALLRASGATPAQVRKMVIAETMLVALAALAGGLLLGRTMGHWIFGLLADNGIVPDALRFDQSILPFAGAALLTVVILRLTVGFAAGRAAAIKPIQALNEAVIPPVAISRVRLVIGAVFAAATVGTGVSTIFMSPTNAAAIGGPAVLTGSIAVAVLGPIVIRALLTTRITNYLENLGVNGILAVHQPPGPRRPVRGDPGADHARLSDCPGQHLLADHPAEGRCRGLYRQPVRRCRGDQLVWWDPGRSVRPGTQYGRCVRGVGAGPEQGVDRGAVRHDPHE